MKAASEVDFSTLKEMIKAVNALPMVDPKIRTIGRKKEDMIADFKKAVMGVDPKDEGKIPDEVVNFFNDTFTNNEPKEEAKEETKEAAPVEEEKVAPAAKEKVTKEKAAPAEKKPVKPPAPPEKVAEAKKMREKKEAKNKNAARSCYGHQLNTQSAVIDELVQEGKSTVDEIVAKTGRDATGVKGHIKHLIKDRAVRVIIEEKTNIVKVGK